MKRIAILTALLITALTAGAQLAPPLTHTIEGGFQQGQELSDMEIQQGANVEYRVRIKSDGRWLSLAGLTAEWQARDSVTNTQAYVASSVTTVTNVTPNYFRIPIDSTQTGTALSNWYYSIVIKEGAAQVPLGVGRVDITASAWTGAAGIMTNITAASYTDAAVSTHAAVKATTNILGHIIVGDNLTVDGNGRVSAQPPGTPAWGDVTGKPTAITEYAEAMDQDVSTTGMPTFASVTIGEGTNTTTITWQQSEGDTGIMFTYPDGGSIIVNGESYAEWKNIDTVAIKNGQPVCLYPGTGRTGSIKLADADDTTRNCVIGVYTATGDLEVGEVGRITTRGRVRAIPDLSEYVIGGVVSEGQELWLSTTAGMYQTNAPAVGTESIRVGIVLYDQVQAGIYDVEVAIAHIKTWAMLDSRYSAISTNQTHAVFVSTVGSDSNSGLTLMEPKLTIGAAIVAATNLAASGVRVWVIDGGTYTENITVPTAITIDAKGATLVGTASITGGSELYLDRHFPSDSNQSMLTCEGAGTGPAIYATHISDGRGVGGAVTGTRNVRNVGGGGKNLFASVGIMYVSADGTGVGDVSIGVAGHIHMEIPDLYLAGNNAIGILAAAQGAGYGTIIGWTDHILELSGNPTNTTGISITDAQANVKLVTAEIVADTAYNITAGSLYLTANRISGTRTGTPKYLSSDQGIRLQGDVNAAGGTFTGNLSAANLTASGAITGATANITGAATAGSLTTAGNLSAVNIIFTGDLVDTGGGNADFILRGNTATRYIRIATGSTGGIIDGYGSTTNSLFLGAGGALPVRIINNNVGIGNNNPLFKLDVSGTLNATGAATFGSTLGVTGIATLSSNLTVSGSITGSGTGTNVFAGTVQAGAFRLGGETITAWPTGGGGTYTNLFAGIGTTGSVTSASADAGKYLKADGTWDEPAGEGGITAADATNIAQTVIAPYTNHQDRVDNPHMVTAEQVGAVATNDARYLASLTNAAEFATAAQGLLADTAVQPNHTGDVNVTGSITASVDVTAGTASLTNAAAIVSTLGTMATETAVNYVRTNHTGDVSITGNLTASGAIDTTTGFTFDGSNAIKLDKNGESEYESTIAGYGAGNAGNTNSYFQSVFGSRSGQDSTGHSQSAFGFMAGWQNTGAYQSAFGREAGFSNTGESQSAFGFNAGYQNSGAYQSAFGYYAGGQNTGADQVAFGREAGRQNTGADNIAFGRRAGFQNKGDNVIGIGFDAARGNTTNDVIAIGYQAGKNNTNANQFIVQQANINPTPLIQGDFATGLVSLRSSATTTPTPLTYATNVTISAADGLEQRITEITGPMDIVFPVGVTNLLTRIFLTIPPTGTNVVNMLPGPAYTFITPLVSTNWVSTNAYTQVWYVSEQGTTNSTAIVARGSVQ